MCFNYFTTIKQILSGSNPLTLHINVFFFYIEETCTFINDWQLEISSKCDIKAENSPNLCKNHKGRKGLSTGVNER